MGALTYRVGVLIANIRFPTLGQSPLRLKAAVGKV